MLIRSVLTVCLFSVWAGAEPATRVVPQDYPNIQAAIDAAQAGDTVSVQAGEYAEALTFKDGIALVGAGRDKVVVRRPAKDGPVLSVKGCASGSIRGIAFEHTDAPVESIGEKKSAAVDVRNSSVEIEGCEARDSAASGIYVTGKSKCVIRNCALHDNAGSGAAGSGAEVFVNLIGNTATRNKWGLFFHNGANGTAENNQCSENRTGGIAVSGAGAAPKMTGNTCSKNEGWGMRFFEGAAGSVVANRCEENKADGFCLDGGTSPELMYNQAQHNGGCGIWFHSNNFSQSKDNKYTENASFCIREMERLLYGSAFDDIEAIAARLRRDNARFASSEWQLSYFYDFLTDRCRSLSKQDEATFMRRMERWETGHPGSITRRVVQAGAYLNFGWRERGDGWASQVTDTGWEGLKKYLNLSLQTIEEAERLPEKDPHLYQVKCVVLRGLSRDADAEEAFEQAVGLYPGYYPLYYERAEALLPRWGGSPAMLEAFAAKSADRTKEAEGDSLYARIAGRVLLREGADRFTADYTFSWERMKQGFRDVLQRYPDSNHYQNLFSYSACLNNDREAAAAAFARVGEAWDGYVWKGAHQFKRWKLWADGKGDNPRENPLGRAIAGMDAAEIDRLLKAGGNPNFITEQGSSLLATAIRKERPDVVEALIAAGADVNFVPPDGEPPVTAAVRVGGDGYLLDLLLEQKVNPNVMDVDQWPPLFEAIARRDTQKALMLLKHGADPHLGRKGYQPIHYAAEYNLEEVTLLLLEKGADPNAIDPRGVTPLFYAVAAGNVKLCQAMLEKGADPNRGHDKDHTPLAKATAQGNADLVKLIGAKKGDAK